MGILKQRKIRIPVLALAGLGVTLAALFLVPTGEERVAETPIEEVDVTMPNKSSRPACQKWDLCYVPSSLTVPVGSTVTWQNQDVAFHSVTSGIYGAPTDLFDSGHMDPEELFVVAFDDAGAYDYFCTLHPWMRGVIIVQDL